MTVFVFVYNPKNFSSTTVHSCFYRCHEHQREITMQVNLAYLVHKFLFICCNKKIDLCSHIARIMKIQLLGSTTSRPTDRIYLPSFLQQAKNLKRMSLALKNSFQMKYRNTLPYFIHSQIFVLVFTFSFDLSDQVSDDERRSVRGRAEQRLVPCRKALSKN